MVVSACRRSQPTYTTVTHHSRATVFLVSSLLRVSSTIITIRTFWLELTQLIRAQVISRKQCIRCGTTTIASITLRRTLTKDWPALTFSLTSSTLVTKTPVSVYQASEMDKTR